MAQVIFQPGAVAAGTEITLPADAPMFHKLTRASMIDTGKYSSATDVAPVALTIVNTAPAAGQIQLTAPNKIKLGDAAVATTSLLLVGIAYGERVMVA